LDSKQIFKVLNDLEEKLVLNRFKISGIDLWPHIRFQLVMKMNKEMLKRDPGQHDYLARVKEKVSLVPASILHLTRLYSMKMRSRVNRQTVDLLFLTDSSAKRMQLGSKWVDTFVDPLMDLNEVREHSYHILETSQRFLFRYPGYRPSQPIMLEMMINYLRSLFLSWRIPLTKAFTEEYSRYHQILQQHGLDHLAIGLRGLRFEAAYIQQLYAFFDKTLALLRPKVVFVIPYNGYSGKAMTLACRKHSIPAVDIQHGVQGKYHPAYAGFTNLPPEGFNTFPNIFLTWSDTECEQITQWANTVKNIKAIAIGNLYQRQFQHNTSISRYFDRLYGNFYSNPLKKRVLISLSWGHPFPALFLKLIKESPPQYEYLIRVHPSTTVPERQAIIELFRREGLTNFEMDMATHLPLHVLLKHVIANLTEHSSTVIEASEFGTPSIVTGMIGKRYYEDRIESGLIVPCQSVNEILGVLNDRATSSQGVISKLKRAEDENLALRDILPVIYEILMQG